MHGNLVDHEPGVAEAFVADLADGVAYAREKHTAGEKPFTGAIYGSVAGGLTEEAEAVITSFMSDLLDEMQSVPPESQPPETG